MKIKKVTAFLLTGAVIAGVTLTGCGSTIRANETVATLGDTEISLGYANFVARYTQATYDSWFVSYYGTDENYWTSESYADDDGNAMQESIKDSVMEDIELAYLLEAHMDEYGVEITEDEQAAITAAAEEFMSENTDKAIRQMGATQEYVEDMLYYETVKSKMQAAIEASADTNVTDEECARRTFSYIKIDLEGYTDTSTYTYTEYTESEKAVVEANVPLILEQAQTDMEGAAEAYSYSVSTYSYGTDEESEEDGGFSDAVIAAADAMTEGQVQLVETDGVDYVVRLDSEDDEEAAETAREEIISERQSEKYTEVTDAYKEDSEFELDEDVWAKVKFTKLFTQVGDEEDDSSASAE